MFQSKRRKLKMLPNEEIYCNVDSQVPQAFLLSVFRVTLGNHYSNSFLSVFNDLDLVWYTRYKNIKSMSNWPSNSKQAKLAPEPWGDTTISHVMETFNTHGNVSCFLGNEKSSYTNITDIKRCKSLLFLKESLYFVWVKSKKHLCS